ncbi:hypothetical protein AYJ70_17835 [Pseudomonas monteilii]|uniref:Uncharacterized protein n=1 Tax=Pseudomonas monteilii TaxID=76759 RepID=A0AAP7KFI7_9PSED|nr:hypothetical protein AYJ70_17835 [Pseudomonas monteilii]
MNDICPISNHLPEKGHMGPGSCNEAKNLVFYRELTDWAFIFAAGRDLGGHRATLTQAPQGAASNPEYLNASFKLLLLPCNARCVQSKDFNLIACTLEGLSFLQYSGII